MSARRAFATAIFFASFTLLLASARAQKPETSGVYTDRSGKEHAWVITNTHTLLWERQPFVPVGGTFAPRYLAEGVTEANWKKDVEALELLKGRGVQDLIVNPVVSAADVPPAAWQRLLDYLDSNGFRYGIAFGAGVTPPLTGTVVKPASYRISGLTENMDVTWETADSDSARYLIVNEKDGTQIFREGKTRVENDLTTISTGRIDQGAIGILYPRKTVRAGREGSLPDLWSGYDSYRDRLLMLFAQVKFGAGLRFFLDPLVRSLGLPGETEYLVPDTPAFLLEWEAYLTRRYPTVEDAMNAWGVTDREIRDFRHAASLIPLWANAKGVPFFLDPKTNKRLMINGNERFWSDLRECRNDSLIYYMNNMADLLKREVANVPVVYTRTLHHRMFTNPNAKGGFDGIGIAAYARGSALVTGGADSAYSQAQESARAIWCVVTETLDTSSPTKSNLGYSSRQALFYDLDWLRGIGAKGFYVHGFQVLPEAENQNFELLRAPEQIGWLKEYADRLNREMSLAGSQPRVLLFPSSASGRVRSGPIGNGGVWWVPSLAPGKPLDFGTSFAGYTITLPEGEATVLWSLRGPRETHLYAADPRRLEARTPDGRPIPMKVDMKRRTASLMLDETPAILRTGDQEVYPVEAVEDALLQLRMLVKQALAAKLPAQDYQYRLDGAEKNFRERNYGMASLVAFQALNGIAELMQPYSWREAELAEAHTFSEVAQNDAASGGLFLLLNTLSRPSREGYGAQYKFAVPADDIYTVWLAGTPPGPQASPFAWLVDAGQAFSSADAVPVGSSYLADRFAWMRLGRLTMRKGEHTFTLRVTDRASALNRYYLALDALLITRGSFEPSGINKPPLAEIPAAEKKTDTRKK